MSIPAAISNPRGGPDPLAERRADRSLLVLCLGLFFLWGLANNLNDILIAQMSQNEEMILAIAGVGVIFLGAVLYLRTALMRFWRFWMLRSLYQSREDLDEIVAAIKER